MNRKPLWILFVLILSASISACGSSKKTTPPADITVAITTPPPSTLTVNGTASIAATVTNDTANAGVDWTCSPAATCGTFNPTHTDSAATTVFTASATAGAIVITAASTTTPTISATADVTVNAAASVANLSGPYTFYMNGWDDVAPYSVAGTIVLDGSGNITGGEQDSFNLNSDEFFSADVIMPATAAVVIGDDGRGTITITPTMAAPETLSITVVNDNHALITEFDLHATTGGSLDLQTAPASVPNNGNAFAIFDNWDCFSFGGVFTSNGTAITGGEADDNDEGSATLDMDVSGSVTAPDSMGRGTITIHNTEQDLDMQYTYYVVGPEVFRIIETDEDFFGAGSIFGQGSATFSSSSLTGNFVFGQSGETEMALGFYAAAGQFTADGTSTLTAGVADVNAGVGDPVLAGDISDSTYTVDGDGYSSIMLVGGTTDPLFQFGAYFVDPALNIADPNSSSGGGGALMIDVDTEAIGAGIIVPQASGATFTGNYAIAQDGIYDLASAFEVFDLVGQVTSDGSSTFSGLADYNDLVNTGLNPGIAISATYTADVANPGRATAELTLAGVTAPSNITIYQASSALLLHVDVDSSANGLGIIALGVLEQQQQSQ